MIVAISCFDVRNGKEDDVQSAFVNRPREVESHPAFLGLEVLQDGPKFVLLTRWTDEASFREWHRSLELHKSHALIPPGLKLETTETILVVGETLEGATSSSEAGTVFLRGFLPISRLLAHGQGLFVATIDHEGKVTYANEAFDTLLGADLAGRNWDELLEPTFRQRFWERLDEAGDKPFLVHMVDAALQRSLSLSIYVHRTGDDGFIVAGEPPWNDQKMMSEQVLSMNAELAVLSREKSRQTRLLEEANRKLRDAHWHLEKIASVLPICLSCRNVKTGDGEWEDVASYLMKYGDFLSHGYCEECAQSLGLDAEEES